MSCHSTALASCAPISSAASRIRGLKMCRFATFPARRCDHAPAISINDHIFTGVTTAHAEQIARSAIRGDDIHEPHPEQTRITCKADPYGERERYGVVRKLVQSKAWDDVSHNSKPPN